MTDKHNLNTNCFCQRDAYNFAHHESI